MAESSAEGSPPIHYGNEAEFKKLYEVCKKIGQGASAKVYDGIRLADNLPVVLKCIPNEHILNWDEKYAKRVPLEVSILYKLRDIAGVVKLYDCYSYDDTLIIVMQKIKNSIGLRQFIKQKKKIDEDLARSFFSQIVESLIQCYEAGVVYDDLQISNVLVDLDNFKTFVIDFGDAEFIPERDLVQRRAPECLEATKKYYIREISTVYEVVIILFCMVSGSLDFTFGISKETVMSQNNVSMECREFMLECLCVDEEKRPTLHQLLNHSWVTQANVGRMAHQPKE